MAVKEINDSIFDEEVLKADTPVFVDFWATWCGPCQMVSPLVEELSEEETGVKFCKVDVDKYPELALQYQVMSIPTFLVFKDGEIANRAVGAISKEELADLIK